MEEVKEEDARRFSRRYDMMKKHFKLKMSLKIDL